MDSLFYGALSIDQMRLTYNTKADFKVLHYFGFYHANQSAFKGGDMRIELSGSLWHSSPTPLWIC